MDPADAVSDIADPLGPFIHLLIKLLQFNIVYLLFFLQAQLLLGVIELDEDIGSLSLFNVVVLVVTHFLLACFLV